MCVCVGMSMCVSILGSVECCSNPHFYGTGSICVRMCVCVYVHDQFLVLMEVVLYVCMYMCVCMYVYVCDCVNIHMYIHSYLCTNTDRCLYMHIYI